MSSPFFFDGNANGQSYLNLLNDDVMPLIALLFQNQFHENQFQHLWWDQHWASCHKSLAVQDLLDLLI